MLLTRFDNGQTDEIMVPLTRVELFAIDIHSGGDDQLRDLRAVHDCLRGEPTSRHFRNQIAQHVVGNLREQLIANVPENPFIERVPPAETVVGLTGLRRRMGSD